MEKQFVTTGTSPKVTIEAHGELTLKGWDEPGVQVKNSAAEHITIEQDGNDVLVRCLSNCSVRVPEAAEVNLQMAMGRVTVKNVEGGLTVDKAHGDLTLKSVGPTQIGEVMGSLMAKNIFGDLHADAVRGNATVRDVQGDCSLTQVNGNFQLDDVDGEASAEAYGNAMLRFDPLPGNDYRFQAKGNLQLVLPKDASARITAQAQGQLIIKLPGVDFNEANPGPKEFTLGDGDASLDLSANGNVQVFSHTADWEMGDFGEETPGIGEGFARMGEDFGRMGEDFGRMGEDIGNQVAAQIEAQMEMMAAQIEAKMATLTASLGTMGMSEDQRQRIEERAREASERATARAEEKMRQAQERLARKMEAHQRRTEQQAAAAQRHGAHRPHMPPMPPMPPMPFRSKTVHEPVSEDERMTVLRMLEQNKITLEQADQLLAALEGAGDPATRKE
jgi:hypothetical protein